MFCIRKRQELKDTHACMSVDAIFFIYVYIFIFGILIQFAFFAAILVFMEKLTTSSILRKSSFFHFPFDLSFLEKWENDIEH